MMRAQTSLLVLTLIASCLVPVSLVRAQEDAAVGSVQALEGEAYAIRSDLTEVDLAPGMNVFRADTVQTLVRALLEIEMIDGSRFTLGENTRVVLAEYAPGEEPRGRLGLVRGRLRATVSSVFSSRSDSFQVETSEGVMGVQGTDFLVEAAPGETRVYVYQGLVLVTSLDPDFPDGVLLGPGQFIRIRLGEPLGEPSWFYLMPFDPHALIGSGSEQQMRSGGDQSDDPLLQMPEFSPLRVPPEPNPPGDGPPGAGDG